MNGAVAVGPVDGERRFALRLVVVSCAMHYHWHGVYHAYAPYAREMDLWAGLFGEVVIAAPLTEAPPPADSAPLDHTNLRVVRQRTAGGDNLIAKLKQLVALPLICGDLVRAFRESDAIHVRCPGNLALPALFLAPLFTRRLVAKYAGQWSGYPTEPFTYRLQRWLLRSRWWKGPVTVYGQWPDQPSQVVPFFTSVMTASQVERARLAARERQLRLPMRLLYVGRLVATKHVDTLLRAASKVIDAGVEVTVTIVGDGPDRDRLADLASEPGIAGSVLFTGALPYDEVLDWYERADILVLVSESEGWPKAVAEAMSFGLLCIGSDHGFVAQMLGDGRGMMVPSDDDAGLAAALLAVAADPAIHTRCASLAAGWAQRFSVEGLGEALGDLLAASWSSQIDSVPTVRQTSTAVIPGGPG